MKTATTLPAPALSHKPRVKKHLVRGIIFLTSQKFIIFAYSLAFIAGYIGFILNIEKLLATGCFIFLLGFALWSSRETARDIRQDKLGLNDDKW